MTNLFLQHVGCTHLELVNLPLLIVLELVHVLFELTYLCIYIFLLLLRRFHSVSKIDDSLLHFLDFRSHLMTKSVSR